MAVKLAPLLMLGALGLAVNVGDVRTPWSDSSRSRPEIKAPEREAVPVSFAATADGRRYTTPEFSGITTAGPYTVKIVTGPDNRIEARGAAADLDNLEVEVDRRGMLFLRPRNDERADGPVTIIVTTPRLGRLRFAGSGNVSIDTLEGGNGRIQLAGSGNVDIGAVQLERLNVEIGGSGSFATRGRADNVEVDIGGSGTFNAPQLRVDDAEINIAGSGTVAMDVAQQADVAILGSGNVRLSGRPSCEVNKIGSGDVQCGGPIPDAPSTPAAIEAAPAAVGAGVDSGDKKAAPAAPPAPPAPTPPTEARR